MEIILITGMSGAGRGTLARILEEYGWYVVDNLPPELIMSMVSISGSPERSINRLAIVTDVRSHRFEGSLDSVVDDLRNQGLEPQLLFLDAADEVLIRRYDQLRRSHPLQGTGTLSEGIAKERELLTQVKDRANVVIDTSRLTPAKLRERVADLDGVNEVPISVTFESFGFKYGIPLDADYVVDMRFLPNPFWVPELRELTGKNLAIKKYVLENDKAGCFLDDFTHLLPPVLEGYLKEGKNYATIGVGCTGGKHRSVAVAEELARRLRPVIDASFTVIHRDLGRE